MDAPALIEAVLRKAAGLSQTAAAEAIGVSQKSVSRWRAGDRADVWGETRQKLEAYLAGETGGGAAGMSGAGDDEALEMPEVWGRIDAVRADTTLSGVERLIQVEQILAAGRLAIQHKEARLAEARARVIEREVGAAESRTHLVEREVEGATARALALQAPEATAPVPGPEKAVAAGRQSARTIRRRRGDGEGHRGTGG